MLDIDFEPKSFVFSTLIKGVFWSTHWKSFGSQNNSSMDICVICSNPPSQMV